MCKRWQKLKHSPLSSVSYSYFLIFVPLYLARSLVHVHQHLQAILLIIKSVAQRRTSFSGYPQHPSFKQVAFGIHWEKEDAKDGKYITAQFVFEFRRERKGFIGSLWGRGGTRAVWWVVLRWCGCREADRTIWHTIAQWFPVSFLLRYVAIRNCCSWISFGTWIDFMASWMRKMHNFRLDLYCRTYSKQDLLSRAWLQVGSTGRSRSDWRPRRCQGEVADPSVFQFDDFSSNCFDFLGFTFMIST